MMLLEYPIIHRKTENGWSCCEIKDLKIGDIVQMFHPRDGEKYPHLLEVMRDPEQQWMERYGQLVWDFLCVKYTGD